MKTTKFDRVKDSISRKTLPFLVVVCLLVTVASGISVVADENPEQEITIELSFGAPVITHEGDEVQITIEGANNCNSPPGYPNIPAHNGHAILPVNADNIRVELTPSDVKPFHFEGTIAKSPEPQLLDNEYPIFNTMVRIFNRLRERFTADNPYGKSEQTVAALDPDYGDSYGEEIVFFKWLGLDTDGSLVQYVKCAINPAIIDSIDNGLGKHFEEATLKIFYTLNDDNFPLNALADDDEGPYDLLILAPSGYIADLQPLVEHKEDMEFDTKLVSLDEIYNEVYFENSETYNRDEAEMIKYFIYNAKLQWSDPDDPLYVLAVGGWRTFLGLDNPKYQFPMRWSHNYDGEPGMAAEQYYSCCIADDGTFDSWDSNGNGIFAEWNVGGYDLFDPMIDVYFGRLACRNRNEVRTMVDKIIYYELNAYESDWAKTMLSVTGDGFQDAGYSGEIGYLWDVSNVPTGDYTIYGQSRPSGAYPPQFGPIDEIHITVDHDAPSRITFGENDHEWIAPYDEEQETKYPMKAITEIVVPQDGDILGNTDVNFVPPEAYIGEYWAFVDYNATREELLIQAKSYDPSPHALHGDWNDGSQTIYNLWINNSDDEMLNGFPVMQMSYLYYEGEMEGEQAVIYANGGNYNGNQIDDGPFPTDRIWSSNGNWFTMADVLGAFSEGYGLAYINGHSSCMVYGDHFPGIPGGRQNGQVNGLATINLQYGLERYQASEEDPLLPLDQLTNGRETPILLYSGCHSGQFDTSFASLFYDPYNVLFGDRYATWTPEGVAWWITRLPQGGSIATIGNTGLGSGYLGNGILKGLTGWMFPRFFYNYNGGLDNNGQPSPKLDMLGPAYTHVLIDYALGKAELGGDVINDATSRKHYEQWDLLGDPTLKIGGYPPDTGALAETQGLLTYRELDHYEANIIKITNDVQSLGDDDYLVTTNPATDTSPETLVADDKGNFLVGYSYETPSNGDIHPGFAWSSGGALWSEFLYANPVDSGHSAVYTWEDDEENQHTVGTLCFGPSSFGGIEMPDITNPYTWGTPRWGWNPPAQPYSGRYGCAITGYVDTSGSVIWGGVWTGSIGEGNGVHGMFDNGNPAALASGGPSQYGHFASDCDQTKNVHYYVYDNSYSNKVYVTKALPPNGWTTISWEDSAKPDVASDNGKTYVVYEFVDGSVQCKRTPTGTENWQTAVVTEDGVRPRIVFGETGQLECYYVRNGHVYKSISGDGSSWTEEGQAGTASDVDETIESPLHAIKELMVFDKGDGDLYANMFVSTKGVVIDEFELDDTGRFILTGITNSGTEYLMNATWEIEITGISPLGEFFGGTPGTLLYKLLKGRVLSGGYASDTVWMGTLEKEELVSPPTFGLGHVEITVRVTEDGEVLAEKTEDASLLGRRILLQFPEE